MPAYQEYNVVLDSDCSGNGGGGRLKIQASVSTGWDMLLQISGPNNYSNSLEILNGGGASNVMQDIDGWYVFPDVENGDYTVSVFLRETQSDSNPSGQYNQVAGGGTVSIACGTVPDEPTVCDIEIRNVSKQDPTTANSNNGSVTFNIFSSTTPVSFRIFVKNGQVPPFVDVVDHSQPITQTGLSPNTYVIEAMGGNCVATPVEFTISGVKILGCTDPNATNFNSDATENDGTCVYLPERVTPYFQFPIMNSFRFVKKEVPDYWKTFKTIDNTLLCDTDLRGVTNMFYLQKVETQDTYLLQFRSNYETHVLEILDWTTHEVVDSFAAEKKVQNVGLVTMFETTLAGHSNNTKTKIYYNENQFNAEVVTGQKITISNANDFNGLYVIQGTGQDSISSNPYFIINKSFPSNIKTIPCSVSTEYNAQQFDIWESTISFGGVVPGNYYLKLRATDSKEYFEAIEYISEPLEIRTRQEGTSLIKYRNSDNWNDIDYSTGIYHAIRVESNLHQPKAGGEREIHRNSNGSIIKLYAQKHRLLKFSTYMLPAWLHEKLGVIFDYDYCTINSIPVQTDADYETEYIDRYSLANGSIEVQQVDWFGNANNAHDIGDVDSGIGGKIIVNGGYLKY